MARERVSYHVEGGRVWEVGMTPELIRAPFAQFVPLPHADPLACMFRMLQSGTYPEELLRPHLVRELTLNPPARTKDDVYTRLDIRMVRPLSPDLPPNVLHTDFFLKVQGSARWIKLDTHAELLFN